MKRSYEKPLLFVERFELTQMLSSCNVLIGLNNSQCVLDDTDSSLRMKSMAQYGVFLGGCEIQRQGVDSEDGMCYIAASNMVFSS